MLRFLHMADLHLCSPLSSLPARVAAGVRSRQITALKGLLTAAVDRGAQMILMAGDVFDTPTPAREEARLFFEIVSALPVPVVVAPGNHDFFVKDGVWAREPLPKNLYVFRDGGLCYFDFPALGAAVYGYAFTGERGSAPDLGRATDLPPDRISLLLAHGDLTSPLSPYAPIGAGQLERCGFAYAALGHIHNPQPPCRYGDTTAAYSGFFAGRGFDELGAGRALLVEIEGTRVGVTALSSEADRFELLTVDATGAETGAEITAAVREAVSAACFSVPTAVRVRLVGEVGLSCVAEQSTLAPLAENFLCFEIRDETLPVFDAAYLENDPTLRGAFYRAMLPRLTEAEGEARAVAAQALRMGLAALSGREV